MPIEYWTDERVETLTQMWANGYSVTRIAMALDVSRGKVAGKISRLELPDPCRKLPVIIDYSYRKQCKEIDWKARREKARVHERAYRARLKAKTQKEIRENMAAQGASRHSVAYRKHLPPAPEMSKSKMRDMLAQAMQNTAAL